MFKKADGNGKASMSEGEKSEVERQKSDVIVAADRLYKEK